jgi:hypothetical protein
MHENQTLHTIGIIGAALLWCSVVAYAAITDPERAERRRMRRLHDASRERR